MPNHKTGQYINCPYCQTLFYRRPSDIKFQKHATCGSYACRSTHKSGKNNHFWGKKHSPESLAAMREKHKLQTNRKGPKGFKHTDETKKLLSAKLKIRWLEKRDRMMMNLPRGENHHWKKDAEYMRHRTQFSPAQRKLWKGVSCEWCSSDDRLNLDHILPVVAGGRNIKENAQTLCRTCNLWKMWFVDRPLTISMKATSGA